MNDEKYIFLVGLVCINILVTSIGIQCLLDNKRKRKLKYNFKKMMKYILDTICSPIAVLIGFVVPKKKNLILFMGRQQSGFLDNVKYLYLFLYQNNYQDIYDIVFIGHNDISRKELDDKGFRTVNFPSVKAYWLLARANLIITDNAHWTTHNRYNIALKSKKVQLWHGVGFKKIRLTDEKFVKASHGLKGFVKYKLQGQLAIYDTFLSTSPFFSKEVFMPSFQPRNIVELGYPRNDILFRDDLFNEEGVKINVDVELLEQIKKERLMGKKVVLYAPTFRNAKQYEINSDKLDFQKLSDFGEKNNIIFIFKLHPLPQYEIEFFRYKNIFEYDNKKEVYPLFKYIDLLITDYSSIYMDFLLLDRPCLFFLYDYQYYTSHCRGIRDDFLELTPGEKCYTQEELYDQLYKILVLGSDNWQKERRKIRDLAWKYQDGCACERIWEYIKKCYL